MYKTIGEQILFLYKTDDVVDRLKMYSAYPVRSTVETEKNPVNREELIMTGDELTLIYSECDRTIAKIFQVAYKLSKNILDSLLKNRTIQLNVTDETTTGGDLGAGNDSSIPPAVVTMTVYGFRLANKMGYNTNLLPMIDSLIEELLVSQVVTKWFMITRQMDFVKLEQANTDTLFIQYNNALTELYKPLLPYFSILPEYTQEEISVDPDTEEITIVDPGEDGYTPPTVGNTAEVLYFTSSALFPLVGTEDIIYVDRSTKLMYSWDNATSAYILYNATVGTYSEPFFDVSYVIVEHNLGKYMPTVQMIDSNGDEFDIDTEPVSVNITICQWVGNKTGTLYFS